MTFETLSIEPATTMDRVTDELRRALFAGELDPGTPLREVALAESLNVARSTVREALGALVAEGLADRVPHKGTVVRELDRAAIVDVCRARLVLESAGVRSWVDAPAEARDAVRAALAEFARLAAAQPGTSRDRSEPTLAELTAAHLAIHRGIVALTGSERLLATADSLYAEIRLALANVDRIRRNAAEQVTSHTRLVELLEAEDTDATLAELTDHLAGAQRSMLETLGQDDSQNDGPE
ncbi:GntR family transcriptional regulator [Nocardioides terrisoli]|uniref:GntR family transcriptional regulator n=1 Tax=Nocardioides terrisoli TaxID=3388267 RepID=UPI00287BC423|nr:GntR family transcriptional regulator [Nocardioides marmorisolisilvae]